MELLDGLTDDQVALISCLLALAFCAALMCVSVYLGRLVRPERTRRLNKQPIRSAAARAGRAAHHSAEDPREKAA